MPKKLAYRKIGERIEQVTVYHAAEYDRYGNLVRDAYEELVDKVVPIMGIVYEEMTQEEIESLHSEENYPIEPTFEERLEAIESAMIEMVMLGGI